MALAPTIISSYYLALQPRDDFRLTPFVYGAGIVYHPSQRRRAGCCPRRLEDNETKVFLLNPIRGPMYLFGLSFFLSSLLDRLRGRRGVPFRVRTDA